MDRPGYGAKEAQTLLQIPDTGAGEGVPLQRLRLEAEEMGAGEEPQPDGTAGEDLVPEPEDEEQEELAKTSGSGGQQQQQQRQPPLSPPAGQPPPRQRADQTPPVTLAFLWGRLRASPPPRRHHVTPRPSDATVSTHASHEVPRHRAVGSPAKGPRFESSLQSLGFFCGKSST